MAFRGLRWLAGGAVSAGVLIGACGYPDFTYGNGSGGGNNASTTSSTSSTGGFGGSSSSRTSTTTGGSTSTSTTSSAGGQGGSAPVTQVSCAEDTLCNPGQICCVEAEGDETCDHCASAKAPCEALTHDCSNSTWIEYECDGDEDCGAEEHCCAQLVSNGDVLQVTLVSCFPHVCDDQTMTRQMCHEAGDCSGDADYPECRDFGYPPYEACQAPQ